MASSPSEKLIEESYITFRKEYGEEKQVTSEECLVFTRGFLSGYKQALKEFRILFNKCGPKNGGWRCNCPCHK